VNVRVAGGQTVTRIVVEDQGSVVLISTDEEVAIAEQEGRPPLVVGFRRRDVEAADNQLIRRGS
jgi:hypothetical protein